MDVRATAFADSVQERTSSLKACNDDYETSIGQSGCGRRGRAAGAAPWLHRRDANPGADDSDGDHSQFTVTTNWRAAAPNEVESEIIEVQEDVLRGVPGVEKMVSTATQGTGTIALTFDVGVPVERALIEVMNRLNQVPRYPADANEPTIVAGAAAFEKAAALGIQLPAVVTLAGNNVDTTGGFTDVGRRQYTVRYAGQYAISEFEDMILDWRDGNPVRLGDVAAVERRLVDQTVVMTVAGDPGIGINIQPEEGVNLLEVMADVRIAVSELKTGALAREGLILDQIYDETEYIEQSIAALRNNLLLGIALAIGILWWFLRRFQATLVIATAIPISLLFSFFALDLSGRTLNIVSLAALAFAMGMVLDASIVVLENIVRLRERGERSSVASLSGTQQVWGALVASTATTVAIFMPILFLQDISAQTRFPR